MTEKVKLPKEVCDALDACKNNHLSNVDIIEFNIRKIFKHKDDSLLNLVNTDLLMEALVLGYEPELTAEEQIKKDFFSIHCTNSEHDYGYRQGIRSALRIHGIHYDWLET